VGTQEEFDAWAAKQTPMYAAIAKDAAPKDSTGAAAAVVDSSKVDIKKPQAALVRR